MNPLVLIAIAGGGYYFYDKAQKKKKAAAAGTSTKADTCDGTISRRGYILLCDGTTCRGVINDPSYVETYETQQSGAEKLMYHANMVLGAKPWNPTQQQARTVINHLMGDIFPECDWSLLPSSAPFGDATIGAATNLLVLALQMMGQQNGQQPPGPGPGLNQQQQTGPGLNQQQNPYLQTAQQRALPPGYVYR